jgi:predicted nucleotidyltransferase
VAITGSVARGDAAAGSDLDLWVLGPHSDRQHIYVAQTPVTLLRQRPREALTIDTLCLYEVADVLVLSDPRGHFARVQKVAREKKREVRAEVLDATWDGLRAELRLVEDVSHWQRVLAWRQFAFRVAATWLYLRNGWRVPRLRALRTWLPKRERVLLDDILGLPVTERVARRADATLAPAAEAAHRLMRRDVEPPPREIQARLRAREWDETALLARRYLRRELLPTLMQKLALRDVTELGASKLGRVVLEAVQRSEQFTRATRSEQTKQQVSLLVQRLGFQRRLPKDILDYFAL